jgi:hypothetical protein
MIRVVFLCYGRILGAGIEMKKYSVRVNRQCVASFEGVGIGIHIDNLDSETFLVASTGAGIEIWL